MPSNRSSAVRLAAVSAGAAALVAVSAPIADAHVTVTPTTTAAGAYTVLTFSVGHGCDGSPTTAIAIQMPEEIVAVTPTINDGWKAEKVMETLPEPVDNGHGGTYTERVAQVVYTAGTPLADGFRETFELSLRLPEQADGRLVFPAVQTCEEGETAWVQTSAEGEDEPELPAPFIELSTAEGDGHGHGSTDDGAETTGGAGDGSPQAADGDDEGAPAFVGWLGLVLGGLGLAAGGTALVRSRT